VSISDRMRGMPKLYRRHTQTCRYRALGRSHMNCRCPFWADISEEGRRERISLKTRNLQRAVKKLGEIEGREQMIVARTKTIAEATNTFLANKKAELADVSYRKYQKRLSLLGLYCARERILNLREVSTEMLNRYKLLRSESLGPLTWSKELETLRSFFGFCLDSGWIDSNPASRVKGPKNPKPRPIEPYTHEEIVRIIAACDRLGTATARVKARAMILLMLAVALSVMDVKTLRKSSIQDGALYVHRNKTGKPVRLELPKEVVDALKAVPAMGVYYFWDGCGTRENAAKAAGMFLAKVFKKSGVLGARAHRFRHTLATELMENGGTAEDASDILGNSPAMIRKHYSLWSAKRQARISNLLQTVHSGTFSAQTVNESAT
jgi:integrase